MTRPTGTVTVYEYAFADDVVAALLGLPPREGGYGLLFSADEDGQHWSHAGDPAVSLMLANGVSVEPATLTASYPFLMKGWPDDPEFMPKASTSARAGSRGNRPLGQGARRRKQKGRRRR